MTTHQGQNDTGGDDPTPAATGSGDGQESSPKPRSKRRAKGAAEDLENDPQFHDLNEMAEMEPEAAAGTANTAQLSRDLKALREEVERVWDDLSRIGGLLKSVAQNQGHALNEQARQAVHDQPMKTLAGTFGAGLVFGLLMAQCIPRPHARDFHDRDERLH